MRLELDYLRRRNPALTAEFLTASEITDTAVATVRRLCKGLRPPLLDDLGLESSLRHLVSELAARADYRVELDIAIDEESAAVPGEAALCVFRVLQEALTNVSRHAKASCVRVSLSRDQGELVLSVADDGVGLDLDSLPAASGLGITGMKERANLVGGRVDLVSSPGGGTVVELRVPAAAHDGVEVS